MLSTREFDGKVAMVTGGGSGIGAATARLLAQRGATVLVADINREAATSVADAIASNGGDAVPLVFDVTDPTQVERALDGVGTDHGGLDLAVNSAGLSLPAMPTGAYDLASWKRILDLNLHGTFYAMRYELPQMLQRGGGSIVNLASIAGVNGIAGVCAYTASKHAVIGLTKSCALDYATKGIRVNAVAPGFVDTPLLAGRSEEAMEQIRSRHPMGRLATPDEIAEAIAFLLSERASFITGSVQVIDGGYGAR